MKAPHGELNPVAMSADSRGLETLLVDAIDSDSNATKVKLILHKQAMTKPSSLSLEILPEHQPQHERLTALTAANPLADFLPRVVDERGFQLIHMRVAELPNELR